MNLYLFDDENIITFNLPSKKIGNFWMTDNNQKNLINISGENNNWIITGNTDVKIISNEKSDSIILKQNNSYIIEKNDKKYVLYCDKVNDDTFECYNISDNQVVKIGKAETNDISISSLTISFIGLHNLSLSFSASSVSIVLYISVS